jgi:serpin B
MINEWVKKATDNLIDSMISTDDINPATDLVLANAVYFKGDWMEPFQLQFTSPGTFHLLDGGHVEVDFMEKYRTMDVACMDGFKVLKLPYKPSATPPAQVEAAHGSSSAAVGRSPQNPRTRPRRRSTRAHGTPCSSSSRTRLTAWRPWWT